MLAAPEPTGTEPPGWFTRALAVEVRVGRLDVHGCAIAYRRWGPEGAPGLVLVHGGGAHSRWWDHVAPFFSPEFTVTALDLSGHGDSGRRDRYSLALWAAEIVAVAAGGGPDAPVVVAHSMGGFAAIQAAVSHEEQLGGIIVVDSPVREPSPEEAASMTRKAFGPLRLYPSAEQAVARFRTVPEQPGSLPYVVDHVARHSIRRVEGGWMWKFDPRFAERGELVRPEMLSEVACRVAVLRPEFGMVTPDIGEQMYQRLGRRAPVIEIPLAHHHVMLDRPLLLVTAVRALLAGWRNSSVA